MIAAGRPKGEYRSAKHESSANGALARLATACGIALEYVDIAGRNHHVGDGTLRALLASMGVPILAPQDDEAAIAAIERATADERVAPLVVIRESAPAPRVRIGLGSSERAQRTLSFRLVTEAGDRHEGSIDASEPLAREHPAFDGETRPAIDVALPAGLPCGYHRLDVLAGDEIVATTCCAVAPRACYRPRPLADGGRLFGASAQLYGLRSARNWGIGDFTDLARIVAQWGAAGADMIGVSPLHALFPHDPRRSSPYSPSSRLFVNDLYLDVEAIAEFPECVVARTKVASAGFQAELAALRDAPLVDYAGVAQAKRDVLEALYALFRDEHLARDDARASAFRRFVDGAGAELRRYATFDALQEHFARDNANVWGWPAWPAAFRDPDSAEVQRFAAAHADRIEFRMYVQWQADLQMAAVDDRVSRSGMSVGVYADLAISVDRGGAETWAHQDLYALDASVGAPPDAFSPNGQRWGLPPMIPARLRAAGYAPFIATLRACMRHAGALRVDHVMGLERLFWVPPGGEPADGAYVHYPAEALFGLLALESHRAQCVVIGEDLGTVSESVRRALEANDVLSSRVLYFERTGDGEFRAPGDYPERAMVCASTHDLPTLAGWWRGRDIELRAQHGVLAGEKVAAEREARIADRQRLLDALERAGLLPPLPDDAARGDELPTALPQAVHAFLAATPCAMLLIQLEDVAQVVDQANLPGTIGAHPNWARKLPLPVEAWPDDPRFVALATTLSRVRGRRAREPAAVNRKGMAAITPRATYRLQLHRDFTFADATALVPYLAELGVSHVYCSPYLRARPGSQHGYDIVDHSELNPEIGSRDDFERFVRVLAQHGMGHLCDVVPNHMGVMGADNAWWMDVLEHGRASAFAEFFDIDWEPIDPDMAGRLIVPVLGDHYGVALQNGQLNLGFEPEAGTFAVRYFDHRFPIDPRDYAPIVERALAACEASLAPRSAVEVAGIVARLRGLPSRDDPAPEHVAARWRDATELKSRLAATTATEPPLAQAIARVVAHYNGTQGHADSFETLHALLERQAFRLAHWRVASDDINYRRFFDIPDLAALRMEREEVFDATHRFVLELAARGQVDGLRIDHPDGLFDPARYFARLQQAFAQRVPGLEPRTAAAVRPLYVVVEKIRAPHERLPTSWAIHGDTGYPFANAVNGLFVDGAAEGRIDRTWRAFAAEEAVGFDETAYRSKRLIMSSTLAAELAVLARRATRIARLDRRTRDYTHNALREAIAETVAHFPVYRTYITENGTSAQDRRYVDWAIKRAKRHGRSADTSVFDFLRELALGEPAPERADLRAHYVSFAMRLQQFTSPVAAKGVEDTAFYRFNRLVSLNDVGGDPERFATTVHGFHRSAIERARRSPATLLATSTHDNKRSEDVRARIDVISEMPASWRLALRRWSRMNRTKKRSVDGRPAPSRNDEHLLYQTLVGTLPFEALEGAALAVYRERIKAYMIKAAREAKVHTSWIATDADYEGALADFVESILRGPGDGLFFDDLMSTRAAFAWFGLLNSVSMTLLKFTQPGVPDIYQGNEILDLSLVDPDNRRPVDFAVRRALLDALRSLDRVLPAERAAATRDLFAAPSDGRAKLWVALQALAARREHEQLFATGDYLPCEAAGARAKHIVAYARRSTSAGVVVVAGRLFASLGVDPGVVPTGDAVWAGTTVDAGFLAPHARLRNLLTGETVGVDSGRLDVGRLFAHFPGALLLYSA